MDIMSTVSVLSILGSIALYITPLIIGTVFLIKYLNKKGKKD